MTRLLFQEIAPAPPLAMHIACYWTMAVDDDGAAAEQHSVWPDGCISLAIRLAPNEEPGPVAAAGPQQRAFAVLISPGDRYYGVRFWPDAGGLVLDVDPNALRNRVGSAAALIPGGLDQAAADLGGRLRDCHTTELACLLLDEAMLPMVAAARPLDPIVRRGLVAIIGSGGAVPTATIAQEAGLSERQFQRRFRSAVGLTPKQFARVRRFRSTGAYILTTEPNWAALAAQHGYADQSHLIRDVSDLTGLTPTAFEDRVRSIEHRDVQP